MRFNSETLKLTKTHAKLADFVARGKKMMIFENHYFDTIKAAPNLKQVYIRFTDKLKKAIAKLPPIPTLILASK